MRYLLLSLLLLSTSRLPAADPSSEPKPIASWSFDELPAGKVKGKVEVIASDLTAPMYPRFKGENSSLKVSPTSYLVLDEQDDVNLNFDNGDAITVEAWVNLDSLQQQAYIIGKGRTGTAGPRSKDQNWAFRLRNQNGAACLNFLFHSRGNDSVAGDWHRWTSIDGFGVGTGWHHIAVTYRFGTPDSIRGYFDGREVKGVWDMGGATEQPPMQTDSPAWIGSAMAGNRSNSLDGRIDQLAIYRDAVPKAVLTNRYAYAPEPITRPEISGNRVVAELFGPFTSISNLPARTGRAQKTWVQDTLAFTRLPFKYDEWGVRDDWEDSNAKVMMLRSWANVTLEPGDYEIMLRSRSFSRLYVDGRPVVSTPKQKNRGGAHHVVDPLTEVPVQGMRPAFMSDHQKIASFHSDGKEHEFRYEVLIGGPKFRMEFGETSVSIARQGEIFHVVSPISRYPLTDAGWNLVAQQQSRLLDRIDRETRRSNATAQSEFWQLRHAHAKKHLLSGQTDSSIDQLINQRIEKENLIRSQTSAAANLGERSLYRDSVAPILSSHCGRCHGEKQNGELNVFDHDNLLRGGESGDPAIVPGDSSKGHLISLITANADDYRMPPKGDGLSDAEIKVIKRWIDGGAKQEETIRPTIKYPAGADELALLRRIYLDTVGVPPSLAEIDRYLELSLGDRFEQTIDTLLKDPRWADHWVGYWQDVLAENPNLLKPTLNNTGPFRYWIHEAISDNKPLDRFATELIQMRGSKWYGGAGGFSIASQNDVPMAAKAHIVGTAFMGVEMKCARCHDAPYHTWTQSDLFQIAAMLEKKPIKLPETSTVPIAFFEEQSRDPLIEVTLKPGESVPGNWPFSDFAPLVEDGLLTSKDPREQLAAQVTSSRRFAEVMANRLWKRFMGRGIVEPVDDWQGNPPSDPALLARLADQLIQHDYDIKQFTKTILLTKAYQRAAVNESPDSRYFAGPVRRRMTAEQIVDSAYLVTGRKMETEQLTLDVEGTLPANRFLNFGFPQRAWEFSTLANERDRPSLALPRVQMITDVLQAFGWRNSRPEPTSQREESPNLIQPGALANGSLGIWLTSLTDDSELSQMMVSAESTEQLVEDLFLKMLTRKPNKQERVRFVKLLRNGFDDRIVADAQSTKPPPRLPYVSWSNHLNTEANVIKIKMQDRVRSGPTPTQRLRPQWRERAEDAVWALLNSPEMIIVP